MSTHTPAAHPTPSPGRVNALIGLLCLIWGSTWIVIAGGLRDLPPFTSAGARFLFAALVMTILARMWSAIEGGDRPSIALSLATGLMSFAGSYGIVYWAETRLPSGLVSLLWAAFPMMMAGLGHAFLPGEKLRPRQWLGFVVGFAGIVFLFATDLRSFGQAGLFAAGILLFSPAVSAVSTLIVKRHGEHVSSLLLNRNSMWVGGLALASVALAAEAGAPVAWTGRAIASVLYLSVVGTVTSFGLYFWLLRHAPAHKLSLIAYVTPAIALLLGGVVGKEPVTIYTGIGSLLILIGVFLVVKRAR